LESLFMSVTLTESPGEGKGTDACRSGRLPVAKHRPEGKPMLFLTKSYLSGPLGALAVSVVWAGLPRTGPATGQERAILKGHEGWGGAVAFSPDGRTLATGSADKAIKLWRVPGGEVRATLTGHTDYVCAAAFAPDGRTLGTGSYDGSAKLWDVATGRERRTLRGHHGVVMAVAFSPDGRILATAGLDGLVKLWDVATGQEQAGLRGHQTCGDGVAVAAGRRRRATGTAA